MRVRLPGMVLLVISLVGTALGAAVAMPADEGKLGAIGDDRDLAKVSSALRRGGRLAAAGADPVAIAAATPGIGYAGGDPLVVVSFDDLDDAVIAAVEATGFRTTGAYPGYGSMVGYADFATLGAIAAIPQVTTIHPEYGGETNAGLITSQADGSIHADDARAEFGVDGSGISVGVLSDSFNEDRGGAVSGSGCTTTVTGMDDQLSGDLPAAVTLLGDFPGADEGAAMGELIHDLAPGADVMFTTAFDSQAAFATGIDALADCGADVIVDDVFYYAEPMFQDGPVAQAAQRAVDRGIPYFTSAGNHATYGIIADYADSDPGSDEMAAFPSGADLHDFGGGSRFGAVTLDDGEGVIFVLQWNEPFSGALGAGAAVDMDLYLYDAPSPAASLVASSADVQGCSTVSRFGDPFEFLALTNTSGAAHTFYLAVDHYCGSENAVFRVASYGGGNSITALDFEPAIFNDAQIYGHAAAAGVGTVAAVDFEEIDDPLYEGGAETDVEPFSSSGGDLPIFFDGSGNPLPMPPLTRSKPELTAPDGTNTTFFGFDTAGPGDPDTYPNFFGTSAAAPHAAAVAALMLERDPSLTPAQVLAAMQLTAVDIESAGWDSRSGAGLVDARDAVAALDTLDKTAPTWPAGSAVTVSNVTENGARVSWSAAADNVGVSGYRVYVGSGLWATTTVTSLDLTGLIPGTSYPVRVEALDAIGNESDTGPAGTIVTPDTQPPTWPAGSRVTVRDISASSATVSWTAAADNGRIDFYTVYVNGARYGSTPATTFALTGLVYATPHLVRVEAVDGAGNESAGGPSAQFTTVNSLPAGGSFRDDNGNIHEPNIEAIAAIGITKGCNPPVNDLYCPGAYVTRGQMAAFLVRALGLIDDGGGNRFVDDDGSIFEGDIARLAAAGITKGCNPPVNDLYCPGANVTRGQMAAFLVRALGLIDDGGGNRFVDDDGSIFEGDIARLAAAGITKGCNPPVNDRFCPNDFVTRDQMGSFLARGLGLSPIAVPPLVTFGDGVWSVPDEVPVGTYRNSDSADGCYWARLSGFGGELDDVIMNELTYQIDVVTVKPGDAGFESWLCGVWSNDLSPRTVSPTASFGAGTYLVGSEVAPGTWRNSDSSAGCYWERLSDFSGDLGTITANGFTASIATVTITPDDVGFGSAGCGIWSRIG
jgi:chitodextrinase